VPFASKKTFYKGSGRLSAAQAKTVFVFALKQKQKQQQFPSGLVAQHG
jgi:hypothetical protein